MVYRRCGHLELGVVPGFANVVIDPGGDGANEGGD